MSIVIISLYPPPLDCMLPLSTTSTFPLPPHCTPPHFVELAQKNLVSEVPHAQLDLIKDCLTVLYWEYADNHYLYPAFKIQTWALKKSSLFLACVCGTCTLRKQRISASVSAAINSQFCLLVKTHKVGKYETHRSEERTLTYQRYGSCSSLRLVFE